MRRYAEHDVEAGFEFAGFRFLDRLEVDRHRVAGLGVADTAVDAVAIVLRMALDVALRSKLVLATLLDFEMNMRRATRVGTGFAVRK